MEADNPEVSKLVWKESMLERYKQFTDVALLKTYSQKYLRKAIRVNTLKISVPELKKRLEKRWNLEPVPFCPEGFWISEREGERTDIGNLLEHALGYIYVQDPASMLPPIVLSPKPGDRVLDLCAAPGSKTTQIAAMMEGTGVVIANDLTHDRLAALGMNLQRMGAANVVVTQMRGQDMRGTFDKILVDAPCSATGTIRRSPQSLKMWSEGLVRRVAQVQRSLLVHAWKLLAPGGRLVYSTCSLEPEEDEEVVSEFLQTTPDAILIPVRLPIQSTKPVEEFFGKKYTGVKGVLRLTPQDNDTEGFFVACFEKKA